MDPVSAFTFAGTILSFIDFSFKIVSGVLEVAETGATESNIRLGTVVDDLLKVTTELENSGTIAHAHDYHRPGQASSLGQLASECQVLSQRLQTALRKLQLGQGETKWKAVKVAFQSLKMKSEIEAMRKSLGGLRAQILLRLVLMLNDRTDSIQATIMSHQSHSEELSSRAARELNALGDKVLRGLEENMRASEDILSRELEKQLSDVQYIRDELKSLVRFVTAPTAEIRVLKQLYFPSMYSREDSMARASEGTFEWLLEEAVEEAASQKLDESESEDEEEGWGDRPPVDDTTDYRDSFFIRQSTFKYHKRQQVWPRLKARAALKTWLRNGAGVFHISGKAGCGKSTLMKLMADHPLTRADLRAWAGDERLVVASFFFWAAGKDELQMSLLGLYRSILFEALLQCPDLIREVFPKAHAAFTSSSSDGSIDELYFRPPELLEGVERLTSRAPDGVRFCFFIDGLDEYSGEGVDRFDHEQLATQLNSWASLPSNGGSGCVKILASSRPQLEFQAAFGHDKNHRIKLHEITALDIFRYGEQMFRTSLSYPSVKGFYKRLLAQVVWLADGVFLWARLTIRSLVIAARREPDERSLTTQLVEQPRDLKDLYKKFLGSINRADRERAFRLLRIVAGSTSNFPPAILDWLDRLDRCEFPFAYTDRPNVDYRSPEYLAQAEMRLHDLTGGLLELTRHREFLNGNGDGSFYGDYTLQFFHRTAHDFVHRGERLEPKLTNDSCKEVSTMSFRAWLAYVWFASLSDGQRVRAIVDFTSALDGFSSHFYWLAPGSDEKARCCSEVRMALTGQYAYDKDTPYSHTCSTYASYGYSVTPPSFEHWLVRHADDIVLQKLLRNHPGLLLPPRPSLRVNEHLSLVVSAIYTVDYWSNKDCSSSLSSVLKLGWSPNDKIRVWAGPSPRSWTDGDTTETTAWHVFCVLFATTMVDRTRHQQDEGDPALTRRGKSIIERACLDLEAFLATGEVDADCQIYLGPGLAWWHHRLAHKPTHCITLKQLVSRLKPENHDAIISLMDRQSTGNAASGGGVLAAVRRYFSFGKALTATEDEDSDSTDPFAVEQPASPLSPASMTGNWSTKVVPIVYKVKWKDEELPSSLAFAVY